MSTSDDAGAGLPARGLMWVAMASLSVRGRLGAKTSIAPDQRIGGAVMGELRIRPALELGNATLRKHLAELDAPLVERVDVPDDALHEDAVLVERDQRTERLRRQPLGEQCVGAVSYTHL